MTVVDDDTPRRYLLGLLSPEEEEAFEGRFASDDALFNEVEATEEDLIDAYARGQLEPGERTLVEGRLLASLIPKAQFVALESKNHVLTEHEAAWPKFVAAMRGFLGEEDHA